ncbi:MAG: [protein-PII] uridylyltransferase [Candidatus Paceibacteria bacterium]
MPTIKAILDQLSTELAATQRPIPVFKQALEACAALLTTRFYADDDIEILVRDRARFMDAVLELAWLRFDWHEDLSSWRKHRIALVAVGGYGRGELHPHSDIDLLILLERDDYDRHAANIQNFLTLLWDIGLEVGHSVRSIKECRTQANRDVTVVTALMEARTLVGDAELCDKMLLEISAKKIWPSKKFYSAKRAEQEERHKKSQHTEYSLEPNVKTSPGGLRDMHTVMWIAKREFGAVNFADLVEHGFLTPAEREVFISGCRLLWKIRYGLHLIAGRLDDRLLFEYQRELAEMLGYKDGDQLAVEQFMQTYYRAAMEIRATNDLLLQHFDEEIVRSQERTKIVAVNERFQVSNHYLEVIHDQVFAQQPSALLEMFVILGNDANIQGVRASTIRLVTASLHLIDDDFRGDPKVTRLFLDLLRSKEHLFSQLRRMERYGILGTYLPEFGMVIGQMQFDLFHVYTVDAHTLQVVRNMRRFRYKIQEQEFPIAAHIHARLPKIELLYIAGLYHDIAKGRGGDHSELGVQVAADFCQRHGLGTWDTNLVCWLVRNHLTMSSTAQRKDISDPEIIQEFALLVQDQVRLDYLYALTVADINATNTTLWNSWRASLMRQLYMDTKRMLRLGPENLVDRADYIAETQNHAIDRLQEHDLSRAEVLAIWGSVEEDYFVRESVNDIVWHALGIHEHGTTIQSLILIRDDVSNRLDEGATHIFTYGPQRQSQFAATVSAFDALGLNIVDARIATSTEGVTFNTFIVLDEHGKAIGSQENLLEEVEQVLLEHLTSRDRFKPSHGRRTPRLLKQFSINTSVSISNDVNADQTIVEVVAADRQGLLSIIANIFVDLNIELVSAKITTLGERVEDIFYVVSADNKAIRDQSLCETLQQRICEELDHYVQQVVA